MCILQYSLHAQLVTFVNLIAWKKRNKKIKHTTKSFLRNNIFDALQPLFSLRMHWPGQTNSIQAVGDCLACCEQVSSFSLPFPSSISVCDCGISVFVITPRPFSLSYALISTVLLPEPARPCYANVMQFHAQQQLSLWKHPWIYSQIWIPNAP